MVPKHPKDLNFPKISNTFASVMTAHADTVDLYIITAAIMINTALCLSQHFSKMLNILSTHLVLFVFTAVMIYSPVIRCYPAEDGFPFESVSREVSSSCHLGQFFLAGCL